jgi:hypothetical protein
MARQPAKTFMINALNFPLLVRYGGSLFHKTNRDCRHRQGVWFLADTNFFLGVSRMLGSDRH